MHQLLETTEKDHPSLHEEVHDFLKSLSETPHESEVEKVFGPFYKEMDLKILHDKRKREYLKIDSLFIEALVEELKEGRPEKMEEYLKLRKQIKDKYPKEL